MNIELLKNLFLKSANDWICDSYMIDIRYLVWKDSDHSHLLEASITLAPLPFPRNMSFHIETSLLSAGQCQLSGQNKRRCLQVLEYATKGRIDVNEQTFQLSDEQPYRYSSDMILPDRWFYDLNLQVSDTRIPLPTPTDFAFIDNELRRNDLPFDGLADLSGWLGLNNPNASSYVAPSIKIRVSPPVDLIFQFCSLKDDQLSLILHAHPRFDQNRISLAVRAVPGNGLMSRKQVASEIKWKRVREGRREGVARINLEYVDSALALLMIGETTVRRQWFNDNAKARNYRFIAFQHFDKDLHMLRKVVIDATDSVRFEKGIAALLFLLGFAPAPQIESDAPDLIFTTPGGKLVIVECTIRISDFASKLGKLVDRRRSMSKALQVSDHNSRVDAILICALPKDQIATQGSDLADHQVILITKENLIDVFDRLRNPGDPDEMIDSAIEELNLLRDNSIG